MLACVRACGLGGVEVGEGGEEGVEGGRELVGRDVERAQLLLVPLGPLDLPGGQGDYYIIITLYYRY